MMVEAVKSTGTPNIRLFVTVAIYSVSVLTGALIWFRVGVWWGVAAWLLLFGFMFTWTGVVRAVVKRQTERRTVLESAEFLNAAEIAGRYQALMVRLKALNENQLLFGEPATEITLPEPPKFPTVEGLFRKALKFQVFRCGAQVFLMLTLFVAVGLQVVPEVLAFGYGFAGFALILQFILLSRWVNQRLDEAEGLREPVRREVIEYSARVEDSERVVATEESRLEWLHSS